MNCFVFTGQSSQAGERSSRLLWAFPGYRLLRRADAGSVQLCGEQRFEPADFLTARNSEPDMSKEALLCLRSIRACRAVVRLLPDEGGCFVGKNQTENQM